MISVDSSTIIAFIQGRDRPDVALFVSALIAGEVALPPVVLSEVLSDPGLPTQHRELLLGVPLMELHPDYWVRAAQTRAKILALKLRARLPDTLIAQSCIDHGAPLIAGDGDFRHFAKHCGLKLA